MVGSLVGDGLLVTPVAPVPTDEEVVMPVSMGAEDVVTSVAVGSAVVGSTPVTETDPERVMPEVAGTLVGIDVGTSVETIGDVSDVGMEMMVSVVVVGKGVRMPVSVGGTVGRTDVSVGRTEVSVGSERTLETPEMMLEITLERSG